MDKSWMNIYDRINDTRYEADVIKFLDFAYRGRDESLAIPCPCRSCNNFRDKNRVTMYKHLMQNGITRGYTTWNYHGEESDDDDDDGGGDDDVPFDGSDGGTDDMSDDDLDEMLDNIGHSTWGDNWQTRSNSSVPVDKNLNTLRKLLDESHEELYAGCQTFSKFSFVVTILHLKTTSGWSMKSFNATLDLFRKALPAPSLVPKNFYEAKKYVRDLGFEGEKIHACVNDCILYRNKLQRLFIDKQVASDMRWHKEKRVRDDNIARHPADTEAKVEAKTRGKGLIA
ncbi:leucine-rich repeat protein [Tanacetum coccineum]